MPPKETIWDAEPHTIAKHRILRKYLGGWLPVISSWNKRVLFIDGFSGPGEYAGGEEGSPIIALRSLLEHTHFKRMSGTEFVFIFIDQDRARIEYLEQVAIPRLGELPSNVHVQCGSAASTRRWAESSTASRTPGTTWRRPSPSSIRSASRTRRWS
jgi:three-Cys-motif partner protein